MPIYEYHCGKCGDFEVMQKMSDKPLSTCPTCKRKVNKLISSTSFQLKGSGWYVTDYARKGGSSGAASEKGSKSEKKDDAGDGGSKASGDGKASGDSTASGDGSGSTEPSKSSGTKKAGKASEKAAAA